MQAQCPLGAMPLQAGAKLLAERGIVTGGHKIFKQLRDLGMLKGLHPSMHAEQMCWLKEKLGDWEGREYKRVFITPSGLDEAERLLRNSPASLRLAAMNRLLVHDIDLGVGQEVILGF